jgi:hypothetical protein
MVSGRMCCRHQLSFPLCPSPERSWRKFAEVGHHRHTCILFPQLICSTECITFLVFGHIFATPKTIYKYNASTLYDQHDPLHDEMFGTNRWNIISASYAAAIVLNTNQPKPNYPCIFWLRPPVPNSLQNNSVHPDKLLFHFYPSCRNSINTDTTQIWVISMRGAISGWQSEWWNNKRWTQWGCLVLSPGVWRPYESGVAGLHVRRFFNTTQTSSRATQQISRSKARFWQLVADAAKVCSDSLLCSSTEGWHCAEPRKLTGISSSDS